MTPLCGDPKMNAIKIIFLDRDGVVNIDKNYLYKIEEFEFTDNLFEVCEHIISLGYQIIIITNQSGIGRNYFTQDDFNKLTLWMIKEFKKNNIEILDIFHCSHTPEADCKCRKPKPGMILEACKKYNINLENSWLIGDKLSDINAGINAGIKNTILIDSDYSNGKDKIGTNNIIKKIIEVKNIIKY